MSTRDIISIAADQIGPGDKIKVGRTWRTVTDVGRGTRDGDELVEITSTVYNEIRRDYVAKSQFVLATTTVQVAIP